MLKQQAGSWHFFQVSLQPFIIEVIKSSEASEAAES